MRLQDLQEELLLLVETEYLEKRRTSWSFSGVHFTGILAMESSAGVRGR